MSHNSMQLWVDIFPTLVSPLLQHLEKSTGMNTPPQLLHNIQSACNGGCAKIDDVVLCLHIEYVRKYRIESCDCESVVQVLVKNGLFPSHFPHPEIAFSITLLEFFITLCDRPGLPLAELSDVLDKYHWAKGLRLLHRDGRYKALSDLDQAIKSYKGLRLTLDLELNRALDICVHLVCYIRDDLCPPVDGYPDINNALEKQWRLEENRIGEHMALNPLKTFGHELIAVEVALRLKEFQYLTIPLTQWREQVTLQAEKAIRNTSDLDNCLMEAVKIADCVSQHQEPLALSWTRTINIGPQHTETLPSDWNAVSLPSWTPLGRPLLDQNLSIDMLRMINALPKQRVDGVRKIIVGNQTVQFTQKEAAPLQNKGSLLNDICMNGCPLLLQALFLTANSHGAASRCALLNSFDLPRIARGAPPDEIWRHSFRTEYWNKDTWILPIHRPLHWVLVIVKIHKRQLLLFDSLGCKQEEWATDTKDIFLLVQNFSEIATKKGYMCSVQGDAWTIHPISKVALQQNSSSCGVWVLAVIAATLRGYHVPPFIDDHNVEEFRPLLASLLDIAYPC